MLKQIRKGETKKIVLNRRTLGCCPTKPTHTCLILVVLRSKFRNKGGGDTKAAVAVKDFTEGFKHKARRAICDQSLKVNINI